MSKAMFANLHTQPNQLPLHTLPMSISTRRTTGHVYRSHSPSRRSHVSSPPFASSTSSFSTTSPFLHNRSVIHLPKPSSSVRFPFDNRPISPNRALYSSTNNNNNNNNQAPKKTCMCSPTSHPGSFRCSLHKKLNHNISHTTTSSSIVTTYPSSSLNARRSAMTNSLVRIGTVEGGDLVKRALASLIRPSSHQQRRRTSFRPRPSRLSVMSNADG